MVSEREATVFWTILDIAYLGHNLLNFTDPALVHYDELLLCVCVISCWLLQDAFWALTALLNRTKHNMHGRYTSSCISFTVIQISLCVEIQGLKFGANLFHVVDIFFIVIGSV